MSISGTHSERREILYCPAPSAEPTDAPKAIQGLGVHRAGPSAEYHTVTP